MISVGASSLVDDLLLLSIASTLALGVIPSVICWLKGKRRWAIIGFFSAWHIIAAFRLAKPESWWARRFYGEAKLNESRARFAAKAPAGALSSETGGGRRK
jgi:hypothetical protein